MSDGLVDQVRDDVRPRVAGSKLGELKSSSDSDTNPVTKRR